MRAWIENQYGENVCELIVRDEDEFVIPDGEEEGIFPCFLCKGDTYTVKTEE